MIHRSLEYRPKDSWWRNAVEIINHPVPLWIVLFLAGFAFYFAVQTISARHELRSITIK